MTTISTTEARAQYGAIIKALAELAQQPQVEDDIVARGPVMERVQSIRAAADALLRAALAAAAPSPAGEPVARVEFTSRKKPDVEWLTDSVRNGTLLYASPVAPEAVTPTEPPARNAELSDAELGKLIHRWRRMTMSTAEFIAAIPSTSADARDGAPTLAARDVLTERARQISEEGWTPRHDDEHADGALSMAAITQSTNGERP